MQVSNYDGQQWGANGPTRITESIKEYCDNLNKTLPLGTFGSRKSDSKITTCAKNESVQFSILSPTFISLVHWNDIDKLFVPMKNNDNRNNVVSEFEKFDSIGIHFYNKITNRRWSKPFDNPDITFKHIFRANCPITYEFWYS